jgi:sugar lactone lactonase YvrE
MNYDDAVARDSMGNLYIADVFDNVIRKVGANGIITTVAGNYSLGTGYSGDGSAATNAALNTPNGVAVDSFGNLYIADSNNNLVRKVNTNGVITTIAGNYAQGGSYSGDGGAATNAALNTPIGVVVDAVGNLYIADYGNNAIRKVNTNGIITTVAGNKSLGGGYSGDGGAATNASLSIPSGVAVDGFGNLFIADNGNNVIREINVAGVITTIAGNHSLGAGYSGDGGAATNAALNTPSGITVDSAGNLFIADYYNNVVRKVSANGIITTVAGNHSLGGGYSGDGGAATNATLYNPAGAALDGLGNLYIADAHNNVIREVAATGFNVASTNSTLILTNVQAGMAGNYSVIVSNAAGSVTSSNAVLTIAPQFHFVWNPIPSPRFVNTPFAVVIQAENGASALATNFTGMVALLSTNGIPVVPAVAANFIQGVWTGAVTVAQTATNLVLSAGDNLGEFGFANPINVVNPPALTTFTSNGTLLLLWPTNPAGFILETTPGLFPANWVPVTTTPFQLNNQYELFLPTSGTNAFFRLYFPGP